MPQKIIAESIKGTVGWSDCGCGEGWDSGVVLDPFVGSGTTMKVAQNLLRSCVAIEVVPSYCEMIRARCFGRRLIDREVDYGFEVLGE